MPNLHPLICTCGSLNFDCALVMSPLHWVAKCRCCGRPALMCAMNPGPAKRNWVAGHFLENGVWVPGKFA